VKERGILFSAPMVRAILGGKKTQTRRTLKPVFNSPPELVEAFHPPGTWGARFRGTYPSALRCPYGVVGDRLWVRETFTLTNHGKPVYRADCHDGNGHFWQSVAEDPDDVRWRPAIHLPRALSRITLDVTRVRVERLQDITEDDARAEGVTPFAVNPEGDCWSDGKHRTAFEHLWGEINGWDGEPNARAPWSSNPWVWVVEFRRVQ
jgi:hypothetical protein